MSVVLTVYLVLTLGYLLGRITIKGLSLGTSGIILVALVFGHFSQDPESVFAISKETMDAIKQVQNFGLACFVASVGTSHPAPVAASESVAKVAPPSALTLNRTRGASSEKSPSKRTT